jgi:hypothetical protein
MGRKSKIYTFEVEDGAPAAAEGGDGGLQQYLALNQASPSERPRKRASMTGRRTSVARMYSNVDPAIQVSVRASMHWVAP